MSQLQSTVKANLVELCSITKVRVEMLDYMTSAKLIVDTEYQIAKNHLNNNREYEAANFLYTTILKKLSKDQESKFFEALVEGGNSGAVLLLSPDYYKPEEDNTATNTSNLARASAPKHGINKVQTAAKPIKTKDNPEDPTPRRYCERYQDGKRFALICNVTNRRTGSEADEVELTSLLRKDNFDVTVLEVQDRTEQNILKRVQKLIRRVIDYGIVRVGGIFVAIMSHGKQNDEFLTEDGHYLSVKTIIDKFHDPLLTKLPKVFLLNMCRGNKVQYESGLGDEQDDDVFDWEAFIANNFKPTPGNLQTDDEDGEGISTEEIGDGEDTWTNLCIMVAAGEGHVAYRNGKAWFVEDFCTVLGEKIHRRQPTDITDIYNETEQLVKSRRAPSDCGRKRKQTPYMAAIEFNKRFLIPAFRL